MIALAVLVALLVCAPVAAAHPGPPVAGTRAASIAAPCPGTGIQADKVMTGAFGSEMQGAHVMVPFTVPYGTTAVRLKYCFDQPDSPTSSQIRNTLDLGIFDAREGAELWGPEQFRGWGGSSHPDVWISPEGFSTESAYRANPRGNVPGRTTRGFVPGPIEPGVWAAELGVAAVASQAQGDSDGQVAWRIEVAFSSDPTHADEPYVPAPYDETPRAGEGWYAGDFHVHAEHSSLGDATMSEVFDYAFGPARLDFITLSDYVTSSGWGEIGRHQADHPDKLITRSSEVVTYRGHANNQTATRYVDHRTGPVFELTPSGSLAQRREALPASVLLEEIQAGGAFSQVNHPTIFPSEVPGFPFLCRGCPWDYSDAETDWSKVDAYEVHTGPAGVQDGVSGVVGPNPFTPLAVQEYERLLAAGHHIAAVGASDSHNAGRRPGGATQSPVGQGHTVVFAEELSEAGIRCGVQAGHTYAKVWGADGPDVRLEATTPGSRDTAIFGDTIRAASVSFKASVLEGSPDYTLLALKDGVVIRAVPADQELAFESLGPGRYGLRVMRGSSYEVVSTPIWVEPPVSGPPGHSRPVAKRRCGGRRPGPPQHG